MLNVVIPMAGDGIRFKNAGYTTNKPFIKLNNKPMILDIINNLLYDYNDSVRLILICKKEYELQLKELLDKNKLSCISEIVIIGIDYTTDGPACTVRLAEKFIDSHEPLLIANSDQIIHDFNLEEMINYTSKMNASGCIPCFHHNDKRWSYVKISDRYITEVKEKQPISEFATCGLYYFKHGHNFISASDEMIYAHDTVNNEYYCGPTYNYMIDNGLSIVPYLVNEMYGLGTPEDFQWYQKNILKITPVVG